MAELQEMICLQVVQVIPHLQVLVKVIVVVVQQLKLDYEVLVVVAELLLLESMELLVHQAMAEMVQHHLFQAHQLIMLAGWWWLI